MSYLIGGIVCIIIGLISAGIAIYLFTDDEKGIATGFGIGFIVLVVIGIYLCWAQFNTASGERSLKNYKSEHSGGLVRTVDVYDNYGHLLQHYEGKLDVETNDAGTKVLFDLNGKRTIIYGAIVIVQEK